MPEKSFLMYSDGGARGNPGPGAIGVLLCDPQGNHVKDFRRTIGSTTNNVAEYTAVITGLDMAFEMGASEMQCFADSELVVKQINGQYRVKTPHILELFLKVKERMKKFSKVTFSHVPRTHEKLRYVDKLVNMALDEEPLPRGGAGAGWHG